MTTTSRDSEASIQSTVLNAIAVIKNIAPATVSLDSRLLSGDGAVPGLDFDSLDGFELAVAVEEEFGLELEEDMDLSRLVTVEDVARFIFTTLEGRP